MSYFIFKNIDSRNVQGLIVCKLPPITKPGMRYKKTEIDGKNGDIITEEGYAAYDKEIEIGLTRNYDIDQIIEWLNGSGDLILSNEEDKYYKAEILERINFERLLRFKTAKFKFHVQPFKYSSEDSTRIFDITNETSLNINNNGNIKSEPIIRITGSGTITLNQENETIFSYTFPDDDNYVEIDSEKQDAYVGNALKNRNMHGEFPVFKKGNNIISWTGNITRIEISNFSRWL